MPNKTETRSTIKTRTITLHLWHLLSLDAPTVATLWTWFIAALRPPPPRLGPAPLHGLRRLAPLRS